MWTPAILATILVITTIIVMTILEKREKLKKGTKLYWLLEVVGLNIPMLVICGNYAYMKTDTSLESIIVLSGIFVCLGMIGLFGKFGITSRYNYIFFPIVILVSYIICMYITRYMLQDFPSTLFSGVIGANIGSFASKTKQKRKFIISGIVILVIIAAAPIYFLNNTETQNKVERVAKEYVESIGYDIIEEDAIILFGSSNRHEKIRIMLIRPNSDEKGLSRSFKLVYFNGQIIEFKKEI